MGQCCVSYEFTSLDTLEQHSKVKCPGKIMHTVLLYKKQCIFAPIVVFFVFAIF